MKVLSLTEPFATLIYEKKKLIETRSWKTDYRGILYIHASMTNMSKSNLENKELMDLVNNKKMHFGNIICKCNLVDCIYMTKEFVEDIKKNNYQEYICGIYKEGRYAWILDDIEIINPIKAKGQLNIWNYYNEFEVMNLMEDVEYGWMDKNRKIHNNIDDSYLDNYILQSPKEVIKNKVGVCWDQVELERYYFKSNDYNVKTYFIVYYDNDRCPTHTFLTFKKDNKYYWFEHSWERFKGIHEYKTLKELLLDVQSKFIKCEINTKFNKNNLCIYNYSKPKEHINILDFYKYCESGINISPDGDCYE